MKKNILFILFLTTYNYTFPQSKKEQILALQLQIDSLERALLLEKEFTKEKAEEIILLSKKNEKLSQKEAANQQEIFQLSEELKLAEFNAERMKIEIERTKKIDLRNWIKNELNMSITDERINQYSINLSNYSNELSKEFKKQIKENYWLGQYVLNDFEISEFGLSITLTDDDYLKKLLLTENFLIISYHLLAGSDGQSIIYNLTTKEIYLSNFIVASFISKNEIKVEKDYYDDRDVEDPEYRGHIWEYGIFNLEKKSYEYTSME